jgi:hypothetical protein
MSDAKKFRFVSPGIFLNEVDQSQIPEDAEIVGPVIIGRAEKGPGMIPVKINSFSEFVEVFGAPIDGKGAVDDVWRDGNYSSPTYGGYAAQAYLKAGVGPVNFIRLMGTQHSDATGAGIAGWETTNSPSTTLAANGGAFGLFVWNSGSSGEKTAALAATFYMNSGSVPVLVGNSGYGVSREAAATVIDSDSTGNFKVKILNSTGATTRKATFSLTEGSSNYIRNAFNTNPQLVGEKENTDIKTHYWLGETFERHVAETVTTTGKMMGIIVGIASGSTFVGPRDQGIPYRDAHTGWFFSQNVSTDYAAYAYDDMTKLFKFVGINGLGEWLHKNVKISLSNIKASSNDNNPYGTFDVVLRKASDSDLSPVVLERYSNCTLDPKSPDYLPIMIGDTYQVYDDNENRYREYGDYPNRSSYIRVVMNEIVSLGGASPTLLPFGVYGPPKFADVAFTSGSLKTAIHTAGSYLLGSGSIPNTTNQWTGAAHFASWGTGSLASAVAATASFPSVGIRSASLNDAAHPTTNAHFGLQTGKTRTVTTHDPGYGDYLRCLGADVISDSAWGDTYGLGGYGELQSQWVFSLDDLRVVKGTSFSTSSPSTGISDAIWESGSYADNRSWNALDSLGSGPTRYQNILESKVNRFTSPMFGGNDGLDITERDPFRNTLLDDGTELTNYAHYTIKRAIDTVADPEVIACNIISVPGVTNEALTKHLIDVCETRADALGVIDVKGGFQPVHEDGTLTRAARQGDLDAVLTNMKARNLNNSYGAAYYPWVTIRDDVNGSFVKSPPSVVALGVLGNTERAAEVWFAPAGFNRGGLSTGAGGVPVLSVETKLTSRNRDDLYDININPIASFPAEGLVVFGQKTLQSTRSALDRINVRRLLISTKRGISEIASSTLFQPNVQDTWNAFKSRADNFLSDVKVRFGVDDFRVVLDETTTTPDLVDRNIMYAKIFIKPTRAIEFIAIDFVITKSGASFED